MPTQFERTTISLTPQQMAGIDKMIENGIYPDRTEAIRAATNMLLSMQHYPSLMAWYILDCPSLKASIEELIARKEILIKGDKRDLLCKA